jgi:hypothetical protein
VSSATLIRLGGLAAILAGLLRAVASFLPYSALKPSAGLELFYLVIDLLILFGLLGIYAYQHNQVGVIGFIGFLLALIGTAIIVGPDGMIGRADMYVVGSMLITFGLTLFSIACLRTQSLPRAAPLLWILSTVVGVSGFMLKGPPIMMMVAGLAFGLAFIAAGSIIWSDQSLRK